MGVVRERHLEPGGGLPQRLAVRLQRGHDPAAVGREREHGAVPEHAAVVVAERAVAELAGAQRPHVVGEAAVGGDQRVGYVEHVPESGRYRLGPHLIRLANHMMSSLDLRTLARPHLTALEQATGETATLSIAGEREAVTVDFVASRKAVASIAQVGRPSVAHATATGKVMLAFGAGATPDGRLERFT